MGNLPISILMWIKVPYNQNNFTESEFQIEQYLTQKYVINYFEHVKMINFQPDSS